MENLQNLFKKHEKVIGSIASALAVIMFLSLIEIFISNLNGSSNIFVQPIATAVNGFFWSMYAFGRKDWFLLAPNMLGCILGAVTALTVII